MEIIDNNFLGQKNIYLRVFKMVEAWFSEQKNIPQLPLVLCHNDFCVRNILCQPNSFGLILKWLITLQGKLILHVYLWI